MLASQNTLANNLSKKGLETRTALIRSGVELMTTYGYISCNIESILQKVDVPKGSFYYYFKSKEDFGRAIIANYDSFFAYKLDKHLTNESITSPLSRISAFYEDAKQGMAKYAFNRGCLIGELIQEESLLPDGYNKILEQILTSWQTKIEQCLLQAQQLGEIAVDINCNELAQFFWIGWEGAVTRSKLIKNSEPLDIFMQFFLNKIIK
ncbi:acrylate utilization transcriptional regulator AcuR [Gilliamella sp. wkB112]|uniref:acrylate utilization transcriptional regulator AcuR n=1 Tax=Gilliamella sp. wkB112 TaxID=3120257 RepID=UPI00080DA000|nr:TetR/AcrR family transcriptional regulator [Gilliamella apicola]OCG03239.1 TetR family transcriptional regulator [Gilliamella apicola]